MFATSKKAILSANRLATRNISFRQGNDANKLCEISSTGKHQLHTTTLRPNYAATAVLPIPENIDATETTRFSPQRSRDITANVILTQHIDITADNTIMSTAAATSNVFTSVNDPHVQSYDCFGAVSLNSVMQSNVPEPFGGMHKFSHLNMPGGQWSQEGKFISQNLHSSHYRELRDNARSNWDSYNQDATIDKKACSLDGKINSKITMETTARILQSLQKVQINALNKRTYCTKTDGKAESKTENTTSIPNATLSKKEQLKLAFKEYGSTIIIFHVAISLVSLGGFYALVSSGIDMMPILEYLGLTSTALSNKVAAGASTFVVSYAIHKVFAPVRITITLGSAPFIVRYLRSKGFLKPKIIKQK